MTKDEFTRKLTKLNEIMNELIFAFMQTGMTTGRGGRIVQEAEEKEIHAFLGGASSVIF